MAGRSLTLGIILVSTIRADLAPALKPLPNKTIPLAGTTWVGNTAEGWR